MGTSILKQALEEIYSAIHSGYDKRLRVSPLTEEAYKQGTCGIKKFLEVIEKWPAESLVPQEEQVLIETLAHDDFSFTEVIFWDIPDDPFPPSEEEKEVFRKNAKQVLVRCLSNIQEHFDLRLCANTANKIALTLGYHSGVRLYFTNQDPCNERDINYCGPYIWNTLHLSEG